MSIPSRREPETKEERERGRKFVLSGGRRDRKKRKGKVFSFHNTVRIEKLQERREGGGRGSPSIPSHPLMRKEGGGKGEVIAVLSREERGVDL